MRIELGGFCLARTSESEWVYEVQSVDHVNSYRYLTLIYLFNLFYLIFIYSYIYFYYLLGYPGILFIILLF